MRETRRVFRGCWNPSQTGYFTDATRAERVVRSRHRSVGQPPPSPRQSLSVATPVPSGAAASPAVVAGAARAAVGVASSE